MTSRYASVLHALSVEPRTARPGETVRLLFRTRNLSALPSPRGTIRFLPDAGLEVLDTGEREQPDACVVVEPVERGDEVVAEIVARIARPMDDETVLEVQALLEVDGASYGTNVCAVVVRSRAVLDGELSGTFVDAIAGDSVRVRAVVTNEGDGPARDVRIVVPAPSGTIALDDATAPFDDHAENALDTAAHVKAIARIDAGERIEVVFEARIVEPVPVVCADGAYVALADGTQCAIPARDEVLLSPAVTLPEVTVAPSRRRVDVSSVVRNDGWADALDVRVRVTLPAGLHPIEGSIVVDGVPALPRGVRGKNRHAMFARLEKTGDAIVVVIRRIPARQTMRVSLAAQVPVAHDGGAIAIRAGAAEMDVVVPFFIEAVRDVRVRIVDVPRAVVPGERVSVAADIANLGDVAETVTARAGLRDLLFDEDACTLTIQPGHVARATLALDVPVCAATRLPVAVVVSDTSRERARAEHAVILRAAAPMAASADPSPGPAMGAGDVPAGEMSSAAVVRAVVVAPSEVVAGAPFGVSLMVDAATAMERLTIRVPALTGAAYVAGSTMLDGCVLLDRDGSSPLHGDGLTLRDVQGSAPVAVTWSLLAAADAGEPAIELTALLDADGIATRAVPATVTIRSGAAFPVRPAGMPYHVDARALDVVRGANVAASNDTAAIELPASEAVVAARMHDLGVSALLRDIGIGPPEVAGTTSHDQDDSGTFALRLDDDRIDAIARAMRGAAVNTLISHVAALRALLPDSDLSNCAAPNARADDDAAPVVRALDEALDATRDVLDRLFVKLRIPGFGVAASDLEDPAMRRALLALFRSLGKDATAAAIAGAPLGAAGVMRALVTILPARCEEEPLLGAALRFYACALDDALARLTGAPLELYEVALARDAGFMLADARAAVVSALPAPVPSGAA